MKPWDRLQWGIVLAGSRKDDPPTLVGRTWARDLGGEPHKGEPTRALLFCTRRQAREWCDTTNAGWRSKPDLIVSRWRVRPIRVRELVAPC